MNFMYITRSKAQLRNDISLFVFVPAVLFLISCNKLVEVNAPNTSLTAGNVYSNDATAASVLTGIYSTMGNGGVFSGLDGISLRTGLSADELALWNGGFDGGALQQFYQNNLSAQRPIAPSYWQNYYQLLLTINSALEGLKASNTLSPAVKTQLLGEAYFLRAFFYFYLLNFFGDVPLAVTSDWRMNVTASRTPKENVYQQIISDLKDAQNLLSEKYLKADAVTAYSRGSEERVRPTLWAATALLARTYLFVADWINAEAQATSVIENQTTFQLSSLDAAFTKNNAEVIWQVQYVSSSFGTEGFHFILTEAPSYTRPTYLSSSLLKVFEQGDDRKSKWVGNFTTNTDTFYFPYKYKTQSDPNNGEYFVVLRLAEQYLIRTEARAQLNKISESQSDLNVIRQRAGLGNTTATDKASLLSAILRERQVELFTEWGHRWFDLKRTGNINSVMSQVYSTKKTGTAWNSNWQLYPLSQNDINLNPNLAPNNPGY